MATDVRQGCNQWPRSPSPSELGTLFSHVTLMPPPHPATEDPELHSGAGKEVEASYVNELCLAGGQVPTGGSGLQRADSESPRSLLLTGQSQNNDNNHRGPGCCY